MNDELRSISFVIHHFTFILFNGKFVTNRKLQGTVLVLFLIPSAGH